MVHVKTPMYYSGFQPKMRRRREGKTDYKARRNLLRQDLKNYGAKKYRMIVRITNSRVICQIAYATIAGDRIIGAADSGELTKYGLTVGLKNYAAAYATGLLCARRTLQKLKLDSQFIGTEEVDGGMFNVEATEDGVTPLKCVLDIGLRRPSKGARVFGAMKGAVDGGIFIPHSMECLPGGSEDTEVNKERIFGEHVSEYMATLKEEDVEAYNKQFSKYIAAGVEGGEELYAKVHEAIRKDPSPCKDIIAARKAAFKKAERTKLPRLTAQEKRARVAMKLAKLAEQTA